MMALAIGNDTQFAKCAAVLGHPEWAEDPRFATEPRPRGAPRRSSTAPSRRRSRPTPPTNWLAKLKAAGVPCGRINSVAEALADPQTQARGMIETVQHPTIGDLKLVGMPYKFSGTPAIGAPPAADPGRAHRGDLAGRTRARRGGNRGAARAEGDLR